MAKPKPDYTRTKFEGDMRAMGWSGPGPMGYWHRNGLGMSEHNYGDLETAIRAYRAAMRKHDREAEEKRKAKALRDAAPELYRELEAWVEQDDRGRREYAISIGAKPDTCICVRCVRSRAVLAKARGEEEGS